MAASALTLVRVALTGLNRVPCRRLPTQRGQTPLACQRARLHSAQSAAMCSSSTDPQRGDQAADSATASAKGHEAPEGPEYIPRRKAKNPMMKIGYAWMIGLPTGIIGFILAKRQVDKNRLKQLKIRQRMKRSNEGEYEGSRYRQHAKLER